MTAPKATVAKMAIVVAVVLIGGVLGGKWPLRAPHAHLVSSSFDCAMRELAYEFGQHLLPQYGDFEDLYYALGLNVDCGVPVPKFVIMARPV